MYVYKKKHEVQICFVSILIHCHSPGLKWYCDRLDPYTTFAQWPGCKLNFEANHTVYRP